MLINYIDCQLSINRNTNKLMHSLFAAATSSCKNGGTKEVRGDSYKCRCTPKYVGTRCESKYILKLLLCKLYLYFVG